MTSRRLAAVLLTALALAFSGLTVGSAPVTAAGSGSGSSISCGDDVQAYSKGVVTVSKPDQGRHDRTFRIHLGCAPE